MNRGIRNEIMLLGALSALWSWRRRQPKLAATLAGASALLLLAKTQTRSFQGSSVVITGGSRGLGLALARVLVGEGAKVTLLARDEEELLRAKELVEKVSAPTALVLVLKCDVTRLEEVNATFHQIVREFGGIDMLINNAGAITVGPYASMSKQDFTAQMELHLYGAMNAVNTALPFLRSSQGRRIVNICSMGGRVAVPHMLPYDVSKFALSGYSQGLMAELAAERISVTTIYPALMRTGSPIQAVFKGDHEKEFAWFSAADVFPGLSSSAASIASKIIESARNRDVELMPSLPAKLRMVAASVFPELLGAVMREVGRRMPRGFSKEYRTGAQSRGRVGRRWTRELEAQFNQTEKFDGKYNMGITKH